MANSFTTTIAAAAEIVSESDISLSALRAEVIAKTGRYDLIVGGNVTANENAGVDKYINRGQYLLDKMFDIPEQREKWIDNIAADEFQITVARLMKVYSLKLIKSDSSFDITLNFVPLREFQQIAAPPFDEWETGAPLYWTVNTIVPRTDAFSTLSATHGGGDTETGTLHRQTAIMFNVKTDQLYTVELVGKFRSREMTVNSDTTYWTENHLELSALAACTIIERSFGDLARARYWHELLLTEAGVVDSMSVTSLLETQEQVMEPDYA